MILCSKCCEPCCDFCIHSMHEIISVDGEMVNGAPIGCLKHSDIKHQEIAERCGYCDDFHCFKVT